MREVSKLNEDFPKVLNSLLGRVLDLAEASISPPQFRAFRKIVMDAFGEARRALNFKGMEQGPCGISKPMARKDRDDD